MTVFCGFGCYTNTLRLQAGPQTILLALFWMVSNPHNSFQPEPWIPHSPAFLSDHDVGPSSPIEDLVWLYFGPILFLSFKLWVLFLSITPIEMMLGCVEKNQLQWFNKVDRGGKRHSTMSFTSQVPSLSSPLTSARLSSRFILVVAKWLLHL